MTMLTHEDASEGNIDTGDEVENLQNSFLEAVHDENVQPKMQCLMMDSSFSMVTMQGEDSGIEWETTASRSTTPWTSETGNVSADVTPSAMGPVSPGTNPAGKIIFVMDEEAISRNKKTKEKEAKGKGGTQKGVDLGSFDNISGRPELVSFSEPNIKPDFEDFEEQESDPHVDKEQKLFRLLSEGSEILNIIAPSKVVTVDEEESREMMDNLSYLEASTVVKAQEDILYQIFELQNEGVASSTTAPAVRPSAAVPSMHPPGAPVPKPSGRQQPTNVDYFEAFSLIDAEAPGGPTISEQEQNTSRETPRTLETDVLGHAKSTSNDTLPLDEEKADNISLTEITSELLDDVFYGNTDDYSKRTDKADNYKRIPSRLSLKQTGDTLFGSQEDILTPIYLPEGPPKIIDPILLEEPKAMAFLYTDLYEDATGSRQKEADTESLSSEKSFHSRHSDREARGYLEKYALIDETPVLEVEQKEKVRRVDDSPRVLTQDLYEFGDMIPKSDTNPLPDSEELTDFFRDSASSSPCTLEPLSRLAEDDEAQTTTKDDAKTKKKVVIVAEKVPESTTDSLSEFPIDDYVWESAFEDTKSLPVKEDAAHQKPLDQHVNVPPPVAPPRKKASSLQKSCLDLAPLTPVHTQEETEAGSKEERVEEKEAAEGVDVEETSEALNEASLSQDTAPSDGIVNATEGLNEPETEETVIVPSDEGSTTLNEDTETVEPDVSETIEQVSAESTSQDTSPDPAKDKGHCIIL